MLNLRVASWNINAASQRRFRDQLQFLRDRRLDVAALQEVHHDRDRPEIARGSGWPIALSSHDISDPRHGSAVANHKLGCMILLGPRLRLTGRPERLASLPGIALPAPERTLVAKFAIEEVVFTVASLYTVTGDKRSAAWGPTAKRFTHATWASWLAKHSERTIVGMDANSPKVDHPEESENVYWGEEYGFDYQRERLLFDRRTTPHVLRDIYRRFLEASPRRLQQVRRERPNGPLAVSHWSLGRARRYDYLFTTPDLNIRDVSYVSDMIAPGSPSRLSDHAPVIATLYLDTGKP